MEKRVVPCWDEYFMKLAECVKARSKDRSTQVAAVIVSKDNGVISTGYNSFPRGINDDVEARHERPSKYLYTEHAERNAIYAAAREGVRLDGSTMYITGGGIACADCARGIAQSGIRMAIGMDKKFEGRGGWETSCAAGEEIMVEAGVMLVFLNDQFVRVRAKFIDDRGIKQEVVASAASGKITVVGLNDPCCKSPTAF